MASVWKYATRRKNPHSKEVTAACNECFQVIKCSGGSTTSLKFHLKSKHDIDCANGEKTSFQDDKTTKTMLDFVRRRNLKEIVSDLATDGITIRAITRNKYIRESINRDGFKLPANESDVMKLIHQDFEDKKSEMVREIKSKIERGRKFSMSIDEYTTVRRRRYFAINLHDDENKKTYKTGLVRIFGSCSAETMAEAVVTHFHSFGINIEKDLVGSTQDGAAVNKKFMQIMGIIAQFCMNHGIHLGVCDSLYNRKSVTQSTEPEFDSDDAEEIDTFDNLPDFEIVQDETCDEIDFPQVLKAAREVVKYVRDSTVRNQVFQSKVVAEFGIEIELHLDVKHRWNSIPIMIGPLIKTKLCLFETFAELNALEKINELDFEALAMLQKAMAPIKLAVETLSREDATLVTAETVIDFMLNKLSEEKDSISSALHENLNKRVNERWNINVMDLLRSLRDPNNVPSRNTINFAGKLASRLFGDLEDSALDQQNDNVQIFQLKEQMSLQEELELLLGKDNSTLASTKDKFKWIKQEFILFKNTGKRTENLQKLFDALLTIKPTSTDVERVFSICTYFCTKIRSRLSDRSLNALVFLKFFYGK